MTAYAGARLRHVGIRTDDIARTADFYRQVFGLMPLATDPHAISAVIGDGVVNLTIVPRVGEPGWSSPVVEGAEPIHLGFVVPDLLAVFERCRVWGAPILTGDVGSREPLPAGQAPTSSFKVADPNGNVIDVVADPSYWAGVTI